MKPTSWTRVRFLAVILIALAVFATSACGGDDSPQTASPTTRATDVTAPSVSITSPPATGTTLNGNTATVLVKATGLDIVKADGDTSGRSGHLHAFIDRDPVAPGAGIPKEPGIVHSAENPIVLTGLALGAHTITVVLGDGAHVRLGKSQDKVTVTVAGPTLDATAPATVAAGSPVRIDFKAAGVSIVKADADTSGKTAHFHVFVDKALPVADQVIEKPADGSILHTADSFVDVPNLAPGEHTFFVVLGDGAHVPLKPLVADKVTVTVG